MSSDPNSNPPSNRREVSRVKFSEVEKRYLELLVELQSGEVYEADIVDLSSKGIGICLPESAGGMPTLALGERVQLVFLLPQLCKRIVVAGTVRFGSELHGFRRYGFEFEDPREVAKSFPQRLFALLDRRHSQRREVPREDLSVVLRELLSRDPPPISDFQRAIQATHGCRSDLRERTSVRLALEGASVWEGRILVFDLISHPTASTCYAWAVDQEVKTVLHQGPVESPETAVRASMADGTGE